MTPVNLYGPRDHFDPSVSRVIPALIKKCVDARDEGASEIVVWSDGSPTREFLQVEDVAEGIVQTTERHNKIGPVNLGSGFEISVRDLVTLIKEFGFRHRLTIREGLGRTVECYESQRQGVTVANGSQHHA